MSVCSCLAWIHFLSAEWLNTHTLAHTLITITVHPEPERTSIDRVSNTGVSAGLRGGAQVRIITVHSVRSDERVESEGKNEKRLK